MVRQSVSPSVSPTVCLRSLPQSPLEREPIWWRTAPTREIKLLLRLELDDKMTKFVSRSAEPVVCLRATSATRHRRTQECAAVRAGRRWTMSCLDREAIDEQIRRTCRELIDPNAAHVLAGTITWSWNARLSRAIARAQLASAKIELSSRLFPLLPDHEQRDTVIHEVCHIVAHALHGPGIAHHGREWRQLMVRAGGEPRARSKSIDGADFLRGRNRVPFWCGCRAHAVTAQRAAKIERGFVFVCTRCHGPLTAQAPLERA